MPRYIDADALLNKVESYFAGLPIVVHHDMVEFIENATTADVVEVVRCKECKYREGSVCDYSAVYVRPDGYCQWGEKEDE